MKRALTLTTYDVYNYGASLQAYALQQYLMSQGCESELHKFGVKTLPKAERLQWGNTIARTLNGLLSTSQNCNDETAKKEVKDFVNNNLNIAVQLVL